MGVGKGKEILREVKWGCMGSWQRKWKVKNQRDVRKEEIGSSFQRLKVDISMTSRSLVWKTKEQWQE